MRISRKIIAAKITPGLIRRKQEMTEGESGEPAK